MKNKLFDEISNLLKNQKNIKFLTYFVYLNPRSKTISISLNTLSGHDKKLKFKPIQEESSCMAKLAGLLLDMEKSEKYKLRKLLKDMQQK